MDRKIEICRAVRRWGDRKCLTLGSDKTLWGLCLICSCIIFRLFEEEGFKPQIGMGDLLDGGHAFVVVDNTVYDVTATQFINYGKLFDKITVMDSVSFYKRLAFSQINRYDTIREAKKIASNWPLNQFPDDKIVGDGIRYCKEKL